MLESPRSLPILALAALLALVGCAAPAAPGPGASPEANTPQGPKTLVWAIASEPKEVTALSGLGGTRGPTSAFRQVAHARLFREDETNSPRPDLAVELPSADRGTWRVNPDGTMETTWKLRPNVKWHDGTPFTSADWVFWFTVIKDEMIPSTSLVGLDTIRSVTAPDAQTLVLHWSEPYYQADRIPEVGPIPRHILESVFAERQPEALLNHRYFTTEFVGLGPFRLVDWVPGAQIEFARFDDYFLGRPAIDRVVLKIIPDSNTLISNALAGSVDVGSPSLENFDTVLDLKRRWEGTENRVRVDPGSRMHVIYIQYRPDYARPSNGLTNRTVRQGLYHAVDRVSTAQVMTEGLAPIADSWLPPTDPFRRELEASIPQFPYDLGRAQRLLAEAGWIRGGDGVLVHQATGERFELDLRNRPGSASEREVLLLADNWKQVGVTPVITPTVPSLVNDRMWLATFPGIQISRLEAEDAYNTRRTHSRAIAGPENRWAGRNTFAYSNPAADALQDRLVVTINRSEQVALHRQLLQEMMADVAFMPTFWDIELAFATAAVRGEVTGVNTGWNISTWRRE